MHDMSYEILPPPSECSEEHLHVSGFALLNHLVDVLYVLIVLVTIWTPFQDFC